MLDLNPAETEALVRAIDGLEDYKCVKLSRVDSFDHQVDHAGGILVVRVEWADGGTSADAIGELGSTTVWEYRE